MDIKELEQVCRATGRGLIPAERRSRWDAFGAVSPDFAKEWWGGEKFSSLSLSAGVKIVDSIAAELQAARQVFDDEARYAAYHGLPVRVKRRGTRGTVEGFIIGGKQSDFPQRDGSLTDAFLLFNPLTGEGNWVGDALEPRLPQTGEGAAFNFAVSAPLTTDPPRGWNAGDAEIIISDLVTAALRGKKFQRPSQGRTRKGLKTIWYEVGEGRWLPRRWFR